jgi:hypothetical protein
LHVLALGCLAWQKRKKRVFSRLVINIMDPGPHKCSSCGKKIVREARLEPQLAKISANSYIATPPLSHGKQQHVRTMQQLQMIGKVMPKRLAFKEWAMHHALQSVDPGSLYGMYAHGEPFEVAEDVLENALEDAGLPGSGGGSWAELVMERGECLYDALQTPAPGAPGAPAYSVQAHMHALSNLYTGLQHMHAHKMCHLDIKPENAVLCVRDGQLSYKFIDFGLTTSFAGVKLLTPRFLGNPGAVYPPVTNIVWAVDILATLRRVESAPPPSAPWEPRGLQLHQSLSQDTKNLYTTYRVKGAEDRRRAAALAADVFGLARLTAFVYACLTGLAFVQAKDGSLRAESMYAEEVAGIPRPELAPSSQELGSLLADMMHMRIPSHGIARRFERVVKLMPSHIQPVPLNVKVSRVLGDYYDSPPTLTG